jgi:hypothetical protein
MGKSTFNGWKYYFGNLWLQCIAWIFVCIHLPWRKKGPFVSEGIGTNREIWGSGKVQGNNLSFPFLNILSPIIIFLFDLILYLFLFSLIFILH